MTSVDGVVEGSTTDSLPLREDTSVDQADTEPDSTGSPLDRAMNVDRSDKSSTADSSSRGGAALFDRRGSIIIFHQRRKR